MSAPAIGTIYTPSNSLERDGGKGRMRVREKERQRAEDGCCKEGGEGRRGRGQLKARKRVWLHYTG